MKLRGKSAQLQYLQHLPVPRAAGTSLGQVGTNLRHAGLNPVFAILDLLCRCVGPWDNGTSWDARDERLWTRSTHKFAATAAGGFWGAGSPSHRPPSRSRRYRRDRQRPGVHGGCSRISSGRFLRQSQVGGYFMVLIEAGLRPTKFHWPQWRFDIKELRRLCFLRKISFCINN